MFNGNYSQLWTSLCVNNQEGANIIISMEFRTNHIEYYVKKMGTFLKPIVTPSTITSSQLFLYTWIFRAFVPPWTTYEIQHEWRLLWYLIVHGICNSRQLTVSIISLTRYVSLIWLVLHVLHRLLIIIYIAILIKGSLSKTISQRNSERSSHW